MAYCLMIESDRIDTSSISRSYSNLFFLIVAIFDNSALYTDGVDEGGCAVQVVVAQRLLADPVDCSDPIAVGDRVRDLLDLPQVHRKAARSRRWNVDDLGAA